MSETYDCATYDSEADAIAGASRNWINYLKEQVAGSGTREAKKPDGTIITSLAGLTDPEIAELALIGTCEGHFVTDNGTTIAFVKFAKAWEITLWYYPLPAARYMVGVENCTIKPYDPAWEQPD